MITGASPVFTVCHKVIVYSLFRYIIGYGILLSWIGPFRDDEEPNTVIICLSSDFSL